jgi:hypothetical protein
MGADEEVPCTLLECYLDVGDTRRCSHTKVGGYALMYHILSIYKKHVFSRHPSRVIIKLVTL